MTTLLPNLSVSLSQQRHRCIVDPFLALSPYGLPLSRQLGRVMELWVVREMWHILDNTYLYRQHQETEVYVGSSLMFAASLTSFIATEQDLPGFDPKVLEAWEFARTDIDTLGLNLFWVGDQLGQSLLPEGVQPDILRRYERLASELDTQIDPDPTPASSYLAAARDAIALSGALESAFILTAQPQLTTGNGFQPVLFSALNQWQIPYQQIEHDDPIATIERDYIRHLLVHAGLSPLLWASGLHLAVLHLSLPATMSLWATEDDPDGIEIDSLESCESGWEGSSRGKLGQPKNKLWRGARGFWYGL